MSFEGIILLVAILCNGMLAGLFFAFVCAICPALRRVDDASYVRVFRAINVAILNGWFLLVFVAAPLAAAAVALLLVNAGDPCPRVLTTVGAVLSLATLAITGAQSVPLNITLSRARIATERDCRDARIHFEVRWNRWNTVRTLTSIGATIALVAAAVE